MRRALKPLRRFIATPRLAKHRLFVWMPGDLLPDSQIVAFARDDDYAFGVLQSRVHETWARGVGTQLREAESGFRYSLTACFDKFPFPRPSEDDREVAERPATWTAFVRAGSTRLVYRRPTSESER
jgi:hypothetical protein